MTRKAAFNLVVSFAIISASAPGFAQDDEDDQQASPIIERLKLPKSVKKDAASSVFVAPDSGEIEIRINSSKADNGPDEFATNVECLDEDFGWQRMDGSNVRVGDADVRFKLNVPKRKQCRVRIVFREREPQTGDAPLTLDGSVWF
jgi:hypothetical protein